MSFAPGSILFKLFTKFEQPWKHIAPDVYEALDVRKRKGVNGTWHVYPPSERGNVWNVLDFDPNPYEARVAVSQSTTKGNSVPTTVLHRWTVKPSTRSRIIYELKDHQSKAIEEHAKRIVNAINRREFWLLHQHLNAPWVDFLNIYVPLEVNVRRAEELGLQDTDCFRGPEEVLNLQFEEELRLLHAKTHRH